MNKLAIGFYLLYSIYFPQFILYNVFQSELLLYFFSPYSFFVLNILHRFFITLKNNSISKNTLLIFLILFLIIVNEIFNSYINHFFIQNSFFKSIFYNPLLMSLINYLFLHRNLIDSGLQKEFVKTYIKYLNYIFFIQFTISFFIYFKILNLNSIANFSFTHDNTGSFYFLFLYIIFLKEYGFKKSILHFILISSFSIINDCRSVQLCLIVITLYNIFIHLPFSRLFKLNLFLILPLLLTTYLLLSNFNRFESEFFNFSEIVNETIINSDNNTYLKNIDNSIINSQGEQKFSSLSRVGSNYISFKYFLDSIFFGYGTRFAYNIEFLGNGVHSLFFLLLTSGGIFLFILLFIIYYTNFNFNFLHFESKAFLFFIFFFVNILTPHFFLFSYLYKHSNDTK
jgi:hypothetical protein